MQKRKFNGIEMPLLGFGMMRLPLENETTGKCDLEEVKKLVDYAMSNGCNYFDTAFGYHNGESQIMVRESVSKRYNRNQFMLADKLPLWNCNQHSDIENIFSGQLKDCGVEYFDFYLLHAMKKSLEEKALNIDAYSFMRKIKSDGRAKHIGISFHDSAQVLDQILKAHPEIEFVQLQINYLDWLKKDSKGCYEVALKYNKPIMIMEPVKGGSLAKHPPTAENIFKDAHPDWSTASWAIRYCASLPEVITVLSGMSDQSQVTDNINTIKSFTPFTENEYMVIDRVLEELLKLAVIPCTECGYCSDCPQGINIPSIFTIYNNFQRFSKKSVTGNLYGGIDNSKKADKCISCGYCVEQCPQKIDIPEQLVKVHEILSKLPGASLN